MGHGIKKKSVLKTTTVLPEVGISPMWYHNSNAITLKCVGQMPLSYFHISERVFYNVVFFFRVIL